MVSDKPHLSQTQLTMYERCGEAYRRRYIENEKIPPGIAMAKGIGVHGGSKANFRQKIESHQDLPKNEIIEIAVSEYDQTLKRGIALTPEEETIGYSKVTADTKDSVAVLSSLYADEVAPEYQPAIVELEQKIELSDIDIIAKLDIADDRDIIADLKSTKKKKSQNDVDGDEQLTFYSLAFYGQTKRLPSAVRLEVLVDKQKPERQMLESFRDMVDLDIIIARMNAMLDGLKKGVFVPALASSWSCDPRYCGYFPTCRYAMKARAH